MGFLNLEIHVLNFLEKYIVSLIILFCFLSKIPDYAFLIEPDFLSYLPSCLSILLFGAVVSFMSMFVCVHLQICINTYFMCWRNSNE